MRLSVELPTGLYTPVGWGELYGLRADPLPARGVRADKGRTLKGRMWSGWGRAGKGRVLRACGVGG